MPLIRLTRPTRTGLALVMVMGVLLLLRASWIKVSEKASPVSKLLKPVHHAGNAAQARADLMGSYLSSSSSSGSDHDHKHHQHHHSHNNQYYQFWQPNSSWYATNINEIKRLFPMCQDEMWCDRLFDQESTDEFARVLWEMQNPVDCDTAKLAILDQTWDLSSMSSVLHAHGMLLVRDLLAQGRVLVSNTRWPVISKGGSGGSELEHAAIECERPVPLVADRNEEELAAQHAGQEGRLLDYSTMKISTLSCFFLPISHCKVPEGGYNNSKFPPMSNSGNSELDSSPRVVTVSINHKTECSYAEHESKMMNAAHDGVESNNVAGSTTGVRVISDHSSSGISSSSSTSSSSSSISRSSSIGSINSISSSNPLHKFKDRPFEWWLPQIMRYVLRPQPWVLENIVLPIQHTVFYKTNGNIPHPLAAMFIDRHRDDHHSRARNVAKTQHNVDEYFNRLESTVASLGVRDVYISSDDFDPIQQAIDKYSHKYKIHFIDYNRFNPDDFALANADADVDANADADAPGDADRLPKFAQTAEMLQRHARFSVADLFITAQADVMVGTLSSGRCRLHDGEWMNECMNE